MISRELITPRRRILSVVKLTAGNDTVSPSPDHLTVNATAATLTSGDVLVGGGNDVLVLYNSGSFDLAHLAEFSGFSQLVLNNFTGSYAVVYLGSFEPSIITAAAGGSQIIVYNDTVAHWNATASISGVGNLNLNQSGQSNVTFDLTAATFDHVQRINIGGNGVTALIDNAVTSGVSYFAGTATNVQISTSEATLDLSHTTLSNVSVVSTNTNGTTFVVRSVSDAAEIFGGSGQDAIQASGFTFSSNERSAIFATASIEAVIDQSGTYYAPAPDPSVVRLTAGNDTVSPSPDHLTVNATAATLTSGDVLVGGGNDVLVLYNSGSFDLAHLAEFSGFSQLVLNNFTGSYAVVYLGSFEPSIITAAAGGSQIIVYNDTVAHWNATASISGVGNLNLNQSGQSNVTFDLTAATFDHVQRINIGGNGVTALIDNAVTSGVSYFAGTATNVQISTSEATLDLSHTTLSNVSVVSTNTNGTTFVVRSVSDAAEIFGGSGQDAIQASGFTFLSNERSAIFATASIETIIDQSGTYHSSSYIPPSIHNATFGGDITGVVFEDERYTPPSGALVANDMDDGTLMVQDPESGEDYFVAPESLTGLYGDFTFDENTGNWTYTLVHDRANDLAAGDVEYDTLTVMSADGSTQDITIEVNGTNDGPDLAGIGLAALYEQGDDRVALFDDVSLSDIDDSDYDGGSLIARISEGSQGGDELSIDTSGPVYLASGSMVMFDADGIWDSQTDVHIGSVWDDNGVLTVNLNHRASNEFVAALTEAIRFDTAELDGGRRTVTVTFNDGGGTEHLGQNSASLYATVNVITTHDFDFGVFPGLSSSSGASPGTDSWGDEYSGSVVTGVSLDGITFTAVAERTTNAAGGTTVNGYNLDFVIGSDGTNSLIVRGTANMIIAAVEGNEGLSPLTDVFYYQVEYSPGNYVIHKAVYTHGRPDIRRNRGKRRAGGRG